MSLAVNDILSVKDFQSYQGQLLMNVYYFRLLAIPTVDSEPNEEQELLAAFQTQHSAAIALEQHTSLKHTLLRYDNLTNGIDFAERVVDIDGSISGDAEPSFVAFNYVMRRSTGLTRNGSKRIGGLSENSVVGNLPNLTGIRLEALGAAIGRGINAPVMGGTLWAEPVIVGRTQAIPGDPSSPYELDLSKINVVAGATFTAVSTQRTRKAGRGV